MPNIPGMSSGSYFPPPVKRYLEPRLEPIFHTDSYGYRPRKSAKAAVSVTRKRCWQYDWVVEFDIKGAFDHIDHTMLMKALRHHKVEPWIELDVSCWLTSAVRMAVGRA